MKRKPATLGGLIAVVALSLSVAPASIAASYYPSPTITPHSVTASLGTKRVKKFPAKIKIKGRLTLPNGVTLAAGCSGKVTVTFRTKHDKVVAKGTTKLSLACSYSTTVTLKKRLKKQTLLVGIAFGGGTGLKALKGPTLKLPVA
jgi:hypothetical protein